jgi:hypothetical protein
MSVTCAARDKFVRPDPALELTDGIGMAKTILSAYQLLRLPLFRFHPR